MIVVITLSIVEFQCGKNKNMLSVIPRARQNDALFQSEPKMFLDKKNFVFIILIITLSILVLAIFRAQTEISTDKSGFLTLTTVVRATGLGALASDKLYNCLWSWWKIFHDWYPLSIFILPSIAFW